ncbi:MAG TPA: 3-deoxy-manno-octulosonate cytidylyltransferase [Terriglobales bacterium]|nr:3-deoxy-manno-octulosonate cytidylyltransferase [Terriglobales bacterium]
MRLPLKTLKLLAMKVIAVIPARLASMRLPRKMLREIRGRPLALWVYDAVRKCSRLDGVILATDSEEILKACSKHGCNARMTSDKHRSGTERVHEISQSVAADVYINVQGDEPMVRSEQIDTIVDLMARNEIVVGTLKTPAKAEDVGNPNAVKVVTDSDGTALYFSRATIPHDRDGTHPKYFKHLGIYAYRKPALDRFVSLPESSLERAERLEQLRFLENGISIYAAETPFDSIGVDTEEDFQRVQGLLK